MDRDIKELIRESYNENAEKRSQEIVGWKESEIFRALDYMDIGKGIELLDLGAGNGQFGTYFNNQGIDVTCIDLSPEMVSACVERGLHAKLMDFYDLNFQDEKFNFVWSMNSLLHVPKSSMLHVLQNVHRILKKDGYFYLGVYGGDDFEGIFEKDSYEPKRFFSFYSEATLLDLVTKEGLFKVEEFSRFYVENRESYFQSLILSKL